MAQIKIDQGRHRGWRRPRGPVVTALAAVVLVDVVWVAAELLVG